MVWAVIILLMWGIIIVTFNCSGRWLMQIFKSKTTNDKKFKGLNKESGNRIKSVSNRSIKTVKN
jgi:hypothetical protein